MVIKKYIHQLSEKSNTEVRLESYIKQGRSFRKTHKGKTINTAVLLKSSLATLIPLAAAGALNAQCQGPVNGGATITLNPIPMTAYSTYTYARAYYTFTVAGINMQVFHQFSVFPAFSSSYLRLGIQSTGVNNFQFALVQTGEDYFTNLGLGESVTNNNQVWNNGFAAFCNPIEGAGNFCPGSDCNNTSGVSGFVGIKQTNVGPQRPGWIQVEVICLSPTQSKFKILERGVESPSNVPINSAITGDCSSMETPLPVEMTSFTARSEGTAIQLNWTTAIEISNDGFEVQRGTDGRNFVKVGWIPGHGTTQSENSYRFADKGVQLNILYYYRLRQLDIDGTSNFSPMRSAEVTDSESHLIGEFFPNPILSTQAMARLRLNMPEAGEASIQIFNFRGSLVKELSRSFSSGQGMISIPLRDLVAGQYFVKIMTDHIVVYRKLQIVNK